MIRLDKRDLIYLFLLIPLFAPEFIWYQMDAVSVILCQVINIWLWISAIIVPLLYLRRYRKYYFKFVIVFALYNSLLIISTFLNAGNVVSSINVWGKRVIACMLAAMITYDKRFGVVCLYFEILILLNLLLTFIRPAGFGSLADGNIIYFTGHKNEYIQYVILFLTLQFLRKGTDKSIRERIWIIICLLNVFSGKSGTGITLFSLYVILLLRPFSIIKRFISAHIMSIYIWTTVLSIIITISSHWIVQIPIVEWYVQRVLGKSLTFSSRTLIWAETWLRLSGHLLIGLGNDIDISGLHGAFRRSYANILATDHNFILSIVYRTGILGLLGFLILCAIASHSKNRSVNRDQDHMWISLGIMILLLDGIMEGVIGSRYYLNWMMLLQYATNQDSSQSNRHYRKISDSHDVISYERRWV